MLLMLRIKIMLWRIMYTDTTSRQDKIAWLIYTLLGRQVNSSCKDSFPFGNLAKGLTTFCTKFDMDIISTGAITNLYLYLSPFKDLIPQSPTLLGKRHLEIKFICLVKNEIYCILKERCLISVMFSTQCRLFQNFIFLSSYIAHYFSKTKF